MFYDVTVVLLCASKNDFKNRLEKRNKFELVKHNVEEALRQQRNYMIVLDELRKDGINCVVINNTGMKKEQTIEFIMNII